MTEIIKEPVPVDKLKVARKGIGGVIVVGVSIFVANLFPNLTPAERSAAVVAVAGVLETVRSTVKEKFPRFFSWL